MITPHEEGGDTFLEPNCLIFFPLHYVRLRSYRRAIDLRHRVENILLALEMRPARVDPFSPVVTMDSSEPFSVAMVGDSTIRVRTQLEIRSLELFFYDVCCYEGMPVTCFPIVIEPNELWHLSSLCPL